MCGNEIKPQTLVCLGIYKHCNVSSEVWYDGQAFNNMSEESEK